MADKAYLKRVVQELTDKGKLIEAGWVSLRITALPLNTPANQIEEMRNAFFAGAQHLFSSMIEVMTAGDEVTEADLSRMSLIDAELRAFINDYTVRRCPAEGSA